MPPRTCQRNTGFDMSIHLTYSALAGVLGLLPLVTPTHQKNNNTTTDNIIYPYPDADACKHVQVYTHNKTHYKAINKTNKHPKEKKTKARIDF